MFVRYPQCYRRVDAFVRFSTLYDDAQSMIFDVIVHLAAAAVAVFVGAHE